MSDDITKIASSDSSTTEKAKQGNSESKEWQNLTNNKFKSEADLAKSYVELEKKLGESGEEVSNSRKFAESVKPLLEEIQKDPDIFARLDERLRKRSEPNNNSTSTENKSDDVRGATTELIREKFESSHGIDKLTPEEQKEMRRKIGERIVSLTGTSYANVDLQRLGDVLENAYTLANQDKIIEKSKLEALASAKGLEEGAISSVPSSQVKTEETVTPEEARIAERLGLTREQYLEGKKTPAKVAKS